MLVSRRQGRTQGAGTLVFARPIRRSPSHSARWQERGRGLGQDQAPPFFASAWKSIAYAYDRQAVPAISCLPKNVDAHTRNPMLSFLLFGLFLLRAAQRTLFSLLLNAPPRNTRRL